MVKLILTNNYTYYSFEENSDKQLIYLFKKVVNQVCTVSYTHFYKLKWKVTAEAVEKFWSLDSNNTFPTLLLWDILEFLPEDFPLTYEDRRQYKEHSKYPFDFEHTLDSRQEEAVDKAIEKRQGIIIASTGAGKTAIMLKILSKLGGTSLIIVPSIDLLKQTKTQVEKITKQETHILRGNKSLFKETTATVFIGSINTLSSNLEELKKLEWFKNLDNLFIDEVHHAGFRKEKKQNDKLIPAGGNGYYRVGIEVPAPNRFGFTATLKNETFVKALVGDILIHITEKELVERKRLSKPFIFMKNINFDFVEDKQKASKNLYLNEERNSFILEVIEYLESIDKTVLIMMDSKKYQLKEFLRFKPDLNYVTGDNKEREEYYQQIKNKEKLHLALTVAKEGLDLPLVDCIIRASGKKSITLITQEKGRGMRRTDSKDKVLIVDFFDRDGYKRIFRRGRWVTKKGILQKHSEQREELYKKSANVERINTLDEFKLGVRKIYD